MSDIFRFLPEEEKEKLKQENQPEWIDPMLATLTHEHFSDENWIFERRAETEALIPIKT